MSTLKSLGDEMLRVLGTSRRGEVSKTKPQERLSCIETILRKASKVFAEIIRKENVRPVMEDLRNIRERMKYSERMNRRLHSMPFRRIQFYILYKSMEYGLKPEIVKAKNTSRTCPICGEINKPNGHAFKCKKCGFQADRHLVAAWNITSKLPICRHLPLAAKAFDEPLVMKMGGKG